MDDNKNLTDEQVKEIQAIVNEMLAPEEGDKRISELDPMAAILDNDLFAMVDVANDVTKKGTALQVKGYVGTGQKSFDKTVGAAGSGADYNDIQDAVTAGFNNLLTIGDFTQPTNITTGADPVYIHIAKSLIFTSTNITIGSGGLRIRGKLIHTAYTSGSHELFTGATALLDIDNVTFLDTSSGATVKLGNVSGGIHIIHNCKFVLPNNANSGFHLAGAGSSFTNLSVSGGGSSCKNFIDTAEQVIIDNIYFEPDTFEDGGTMIKIGSPSKENLKENLKAVAKISTMDNVVCGLGTATMLISVGSPFTQVSNINGSINLYYGASNCNTANCSIKDFIFFGNRDTNYFVNCKSIGNTAITMAGDDSQFVNCNFNAAVTLDVGSSNNQFLLCKSTGGFTDNGTNNSFITDVSEDGTLAANSNRLLSSQKSIKTYVDSKKHFVDLKNIIYRNGAGNDANNGKSQGAPKLTIASAITAGSAQTPSSSNMVTIKDLGGARISEDVTLPSWMILDMEDADVIGQVTLGIAMAADSHFYFNKASPVANAACIRISGAGNRYIRGNSTGAATNSTFISATGGATVYADIVNANAVATGAKFSAITTGTHLYLNATRFQETVASTSDGASNVVSRIGERVAAGYTDNTNHAGDFIFQGLTATGYVGFGGAASGTYPRTKRMRYSGTLGAAGGFVSIPAATLGISTTFQIVNATVWGWYPTASAWIPNGNLWGEVINLRIVVGGLQIETPAASTTMAGQRFHLVYEYQQTDFLTA